MNRWIMVECCRTCNDRVHRNDELTHSSTRAEEVQHNAIWGHGSPSIAWSSCATNDVYWCDWFSQFVQRQISFPSKCPLRHLHWTLCGATHDVQPHLTRSNKACGAAGRVIHWIPTEEWLAGSSPHSGVQSQPSSCGPGRELPGWRARRYFAAW